MMNNSDESPTTTATTTTTTKTMMMIRLRVEGMMCQRNCGSTVENALRAVPGVIDAGACFASQSAWAQVQVTTSNPNNSNNNTTPISPPTPP